MARKFIFLIFAYFISTGILHADESYQPLNKEQIYSMIPSEQRVVVSLAGSWRKSFDGSEWTKTEIPHSNEESNTVYLTKTFRIDSELVRRFAWQIYFLGVNDQIEIYINEQFVGRYFGGMTPFTVKIPQRFLEGATNNIKLIIKPVSHYIEQIQSQNMTPKKSYTGVIREMFLIGTPQVWISDVRCNSGIIDGGNAGEIRANVDISAGLIERLIEAQPDSLRPTDRSKISVSLEAELMASAGTEPVARSQPMTIELENERTVTKDISFRINSPKLWSPSDPNLYYLKFKLVKNGNVLDDIGTEIGIRDIRILQDPAKSAVFLNGKEIKLKGITYVEEHSTSLGTLSPETIEKDIRLIKTLGANLIRFKYNPPHPYLLKLCDRMGIMAMIELPAYEVPSNILSIDEVEVRMKNIAKNLISVYHNYPSLISWGLGDGIQEDEKNAERYFKSISKIFKSGSDKLLYKIVLFGAESIYTEDFDLIGFRHDRKKYRFDHFKQELARMQSMTGGLPAFASYGIPIRPDNHNGYSDPLSIESQAYHIRNSFHIVNERNLSGSIVNTFNDFKVEEPVLILNNDDLYNYTSGIVSAERNQRLAYTTLQTLYNREKEPLLNAGSYTESTPVVFIIVGLLLGIVLVFLINRFRRFREYLFRSVLRPYNFYADIRDQRIMSTVQTLLLGLVISFTLGIYLSSVFYYYRTNILSQYIYMILLPWQGLQELFYRVIWMPELLMLSVTVIILFGAVLISLISKLIALLVRARIFYRDTFTIAIWSAVPALIMLPVAIVLVRLLVFEPSLNIFIFLLFAMILVWVLFRILRATAVVFDVPSLKSYLIGLVIIGFAAGIILVFYQYQYSIFAYAEYFTEVLLY